MHWIAPDKTDAASNTLEKRFPDAARQRQIQSLRRTHDLLLPCLLSGQVELATN
jgi:hypothetical protein